MVCKFKKIIIIICLIFISSCRKKLGDSISHAEWLKLMIDVANIELTHTERAYFPYIKKNHPYFSIVQTAVDWKIIKVQKDLKLDDIVTKDWLAYTLVNFLDYPLKYDKAKVHDSYKSDFKHEIEMSVKLGIFSVDEKNNFYPDQQIKREEALKKLHKVLDMIDHKETIASLNKVKWKNNLRISEVGQERYHPENNTIDILPSDKIQNGSIIKIVKRYFKVLNWQNNKANVREINALELSESIHLSGETKLDLTKALLMPQNTLQKMSMLSSMFAVEKPLSIFGYSGFLRINEKGLNVRLEKQLALKVKAFTEVDISALSLKYDWHSKGMNIDNAYVQFRFHSQEKMGIEREKNKFYQLNPNIEWSNIYSYLIPKEQYVHTEIPIVTLRVPIPGAPMLQVKLSLSISLSLEGHLHITLHQQNRLGFQIRNNHIRWLNSTNKQHYLKSEAKARAMANLRFNLDLVAFSLANISLQAGIESQLQDKVVFYDKQGKQQEIEGPFNDDIQHVRGKIRYCRNHQANWILDIFFNDESTVLYRFGWSKKISLLKAEKAIIYKGAGQDLAACKLMAPKDINHLYHEDGFGIEKLSFALKKGENKTIEFQELPQGYTLNDIEVKVIDDKILRNDFLTIYALHTGSSSLRVQTKDHKHRIYLTIMVIT